jgi:hypothetical protein
MPVWLELFVDFPWFAFCMLFTPVEVCWKSNIMTKLAELVIVADAI